jgi:hypothetical protein
MSIAKINKKGNLVIPRDAIQGMITFEIDKEFEVLTEEEYEKDHKNKPESKLKGAIVLSPLKGLTGKDYDIPF